MRRARAASVKRALCAAAAVLTAATFAIPASAVPVVRMTTAGDIARVHHVSPHQCGVKQASFARICRPSAHTSCLRASSRGVKGFSNTLCAARQTACRSCLDQLRACIAKIGHAKRTEYSCDECTGKFSRCIGRRYPKLKS